MSDETPTDAHEASDDGSGKIDVRKIYRGDELPPGAVRVDKRNLARFTPPGRSVDPHGVPPIGEILLPRGIVLADHGIDECDELRVLPFRFPFYTRAYALTAGERLLAVLRNVQPQELSSGQYVVVQFDESGGWDAIFGKLSRVGTFDIRIEQPDGTVSTIDHDLIRFVGKVMCWWDDGARK